MSSEPFVVYDFDPRNLPPDLLQAIGLITAAASQTESVVQQFIGSLLGIDQLEVIALGAHMAAPLKDHIARTLIELNSGSVQMIDEVDELLDAISDAQNRRNTIVHNSLARHPDTGEVFSFREMARGSLQVSLKPISVDQIKQDASLIYEAGMDLMRFMIKYNISPRDRTRNIHSPVNRKKRARQERKDLRVRDSSSPAGTD